MAKAIGRLYSAQAKRLVQQSRNPRGNAPRELRLKFKSLKGQKGTEAELGWENLTLKKIFKNMKGAEKNQQKINSFENRIRFWFTNIFVLKEAGAKFNNSWIIRVKKDGEFQVSADKVENYIKLVLDPIGTKYGQLALLKSISEEAERMARLSHFQTQRISDLMFEPVGERYPNVCGFIRHDAINQKTIICSRIVSIKSIVKRLEGQLKWRQKPL